MNIMIEISGMKELDVKLELLKQRVRERAEIAMAKASTIVQRRAKENISGMNGHTRHVLTGNLRRNIKVKSGFVSTFGLEGVIGTDVPYAPYVESLPDGGYLYPALKEVGLQALNFFHNALVAAIILKPMSPYAGEDMDEAGGS
jgi:hypothetical protein